MAKVAFLGLGVMGYPMAGHLKNKGGHEVTVYNRNAAKADKWVAQYGGKKASTPKEAAAGRVASAFKSLCMRSCRPFCCGRAGSMSSGRIASRSH